MLSASTTRSFWLSARVATCSLAWSTTGAAASCTLSVAWPTVSCTFSAAFPTVPRSDSVAGSVAPDPIRPEPPYPASRIVMSTSSLAGHFGGRMQRNRPDRAQEARSVPLVDIRGRVRRFMQTCISLSVRAQGAIVADPG